MRAISGFNLSMLLILSCKSLNSANGVVSGDVLWSEGQLKNGIAECLAGNSNIPDVSSYCTCLVDAIASRWNYEDYSKNKPNYDDKITTEGAVDKCKVRAVNNPVTADSIEKGITIPTKGLIGATHPILSSEITGISSSYETKDKKIFFSWIDGNDSKSGIRDYTIHRYELSKCAGLSIDTATIRGTSFPFDGEEGKTYSFRVSAYNNDGLSVLSDCSNDLTIDTLAPTSTAIMINDGNSYTTSSDATLTLSAVGAISMYIANTPGCIAGGVWEPYAQTKSWTLEQTNTTATVYAKFKDAAANESACINTSIIQDNVAPSLSNAAFLINGGASYTSNISVRLSIFVDGASGMYITNVADCTSGGSWETYATKKNWTLGQTNATATIFAKFKDNAENESLCISASIIHDDVVPTDASIIINDGATYSSTTVVRVSLTAVGSNQMYITNVPACASGGAWENYTTSRLWTLGQTNTTATVFAKFRDNSGNVTACVSASIVHNVAPIDESISINDNNDFTDSMTVDLTLSSTGATQMYITNDAAECDTGGIWEDFVAKKSWVLNQTRDIATVYVKFRNSADYESHCVNDTIKHRWSTNTLSEARNDLAATTVGSKVFFAGGLKHNGGSNKIDIYDSSTNLWSQAALSVPRSNLVATSVGDKAIFAGGNAGSGATSIVDIYDSMANRWTQAALSEARYNLAAASVGTKAIFAGGITSDLTSSVSNRIDIYDSSTNTWSTATLSLARSSLVALTIGTKVLFAGGSGYNKGSSFYSDRIDIYDSSTNTWSQASLSEARCCLAATTVGEKAMFAGGWGSDFATNRVDVYDYSTDAWSTAMLSESRNRLVGTTIGNKAIFAGGYNGSLASNRVDIYDLSTDSWIQSSLSEARSGFSAATVGNRAIFSGGYADYNFSNRVDIYEP